MRGGSARVQFPKNVAPPVIDRASLVEVDEAYLRQLEAAKIALVELRFHLEDMPCRNNGGALVRWKIRAAEIVCQGIDE